MLTISVKLTLFVFIFIPISGLIISKIGKNLKAKSTRVQEEQGYFISILGRLDGYFVFSLFFRIQSSHGRSR